MINIGQIAKGAYNAATDKEEALYQQRIQICRACPEIENTLLGETCNACGCLLNLKCRVPQASCKLNKWSMIND